MNPILGARVETGVLSVFPLRKRTVDALSEISEVVFAEKKAKLPQARAIHIQAEQHYQQGNECLAMLCFKYAVYYANQQNMEPSVVVQMHQRLATLYQKTGNVEKAQEHLHQAWMLCSSHATVPMDGKVNVLEELASCSMHKQDFAGALRWYGELLSLAKEESGIAQSTILHACAYAGRACRHLQKRELARQYLTQAWNGAQTISLEEDFLLYVGYYLACSCEEMQEVEQAIDYLQKAKKWGEQCVLGRGMTCIYHKLATLYQDRGDLVLARECLESALRVMQERNIDVDLQVDVYAGLGRLCLLEEKKEESCLWHHKVLALESRVSLPHPGVIASYANLGFVAFSGKEYSQAELYFKKALEKEGEQVTRFPAFYFNVGVSCAKQDKNQEALDYFIKAQRAYGEHSSKRGDLQKWIEELENRILLVRDP